MNNIQIWQSEAERMRLNGVAWACPDPHHDMSAPNDFRAQEVYYRKEYPTWFLDEDGPSVEQRLEDMKNQLERLEGSIQELTMRRRGLFF
jgi:hypothetical protein